MNLEAVNKNLEGEVKNLKLKLDESIGNSLRFQNEIRQLSSSNQELQAKNTELSIKINNSLEKIKRTELKVNEIRNVRNDVHYFEFYDTLVSNLEELFECPLSMADLTSPMILPSGRTIQEDNLDELIRRNSLDPFNKNLRVQHKIVNRFVFDVKDVIDNSQKKVKEEAMKRRAAEEAKIRAQQNSKSVGIQANIL